MGISGIFGGAEAVAFTVIPFIVIIVFIIVISQFVINGVRGAKQWHKNEQSPRLTVDATVVSRRTDIQVYHHHNGDNMVSHTGSTTRYYVTFEVESKDRIEFEVKGTEYGMLVENDIGRLSFQGTRYLGFERRR